MFFFLLFSLMDAPQVSLTAITAVLHPPLPPFYVAVFPQGSGSVPADLVERRFVFLRYFLLASCGLWLHSLNGDGDAALLATQQRLTAGSAPVDPFFVPAARTCAAASLKELSTVITAPSALEITFSALQPLRLQLNCVTVRLLALLGKDDFRWETCKVRCD